MPRIPADQLPSPSTMAVVCNRLGYRLRTVLKATPQQKIQATDAIFDTIKKDHLEEDAERVKRLSADLVVGAVLLRGAKTPHVVTAAMV